jgi:hypothetical protein
VKLAAVVLAAVALAAVVGTAQAQTPPRMPHPAAGKEQCLACHAANANPNIRSQPAAHQFPATACAGCHQPMAHRPPAVPHETGANFAQCRTCHKPGNPATGPKAPPAFHARYNVATCTMCHTHAAGGH